MRSTRMVTRLSAVVTLTLLASLAFGFRNYPGNAVKAKWSAIVVHTGNGEADIHFTADIPGGWRMYSQNMAGVDGPLATNIEFDPDPLFEIVGSPKETGKAVSFFEPQLGIEVKCMEGQAKYIQHIKYKAGEPFAIKCMINYMLNRDGEMLPPDEEDFTITVQE